MDIKLQHSEPEQELKNAILSIWTNKWKILIFTSIGAIFSVIYALLMPNIYQAKATFLPPKSNSGTASSILNQLSNIPFLPGIGAKSDGDPFQILLAHLHKKKNLQKLFEEFNLKKHYKIDSPYFVDIRKKYLNALTFDHDQRSGIVYIMFEDEDPNLAMRVVNWNLDILSKISKSTVVTENRMKTVFLQKRLNEVSNELKIAEENLKSFEEKHKVYAIESQSKATIEASSRIYSEIAILFVKIKVKSKLGVHENHPEILALRHEIEELQKQLKGIEDGHLINPQLFSEKEKPEGMTYIPLQKIPSLKLDIERLFRVKSIQQEIFKVLAKEMEVAKIEASKDQEIIEIIERASLPEKKFKPRRSVICIVLTFLSFFASCLIMALKSTWKNQLTNFKS